MRFNGIAQKNLFGALGKEGKDENLVSKHYYNW